MWLEIGSVQKRSTTYMRGLMIGDHDNAREVGYRAMIYDPRQVLISPTVTVRPETVSLHGVQRQEERQRVEHHILKETDGPIAGQIVLIIVNESVVSIRLPYVDKRSCCPIIARSVARIARFLRACFRR